MPEPNGAVPCPSAATSNVRLPDASNTLIYVAPPTDSPKLPSYVVPAPSLPVSSDIPPYAVPPPPETNTVPPSPHSSNMVPPPTDTTP
jgi:hypothetical protein